MIPLDRLVPLIPVVFAAMWGLGWFRRQSAKSAMSLGNAALGGTVMFAGLVYLWKNRKDAVTVVAISCLLGSLGLLLTLWWLMPEWRLYIIAPVAAAALCAYIAWDYRATGGAPLRVVLDFKRAEVRARNAVTATHDNARPRAAHRTQDGWRIDVDHTGKIEPELVGQALQSGGAKVVPTDRLGRSTIVLDDKARSDWERLYEPRPWLAPTTLKAGRDITIGFDVDGAPVSIPWIGSDGRHVLCGGSTGGGKSVLLRVIIAELAHCPDVELVLCDPKMVEFRGWAERAHVARGPEATGRAFDAVYTEMMRRYNGMPEDQVEWSDSGGKRIVMVVDEIGALRRIGSAKERTEREQKLELILSMGRAAGIGAILATQRPSHEAMSTEVRDNCRVRIGMGCESLQQATMIMGDSVDIAPCQTIPESLNGGMFVRVDRRATRSRSLFLGPSEPRKIAAQTAGYKGEAAWLAKAK